jgi:SH3-like domain-containing protein
MKAFGLSLALRIVVVCGLAPLALPGGAAADPVVQGEEHCVVNVRSDDALNMRERPSAHARVAARKRHGECGILVTGACRGTWCPVEDGHSVGWVHRRYIAMVSPAMYCVAGVARGDRLSVRAYPSAQSRTLTRLARHQCDIAFLPYAVGNWQKIRVDGWQGWVNRRYVSGQ